jgi:flavin-binding protein dodecin
MVKRHLMLWRDMIVPLHNKIQQDIVPAINRARRHQQALTHIRIINAEGNVAGTSTAIAHRNATMEISLQWCDSHITAARNVAK